MVTFLIVKSCRYFFYTTMNVIVKVNVNFNDKVSTKDALNNRPLFFFFFFFFFFIIIIIIAMGYRIHVFNANGEDASRTRRSGIVCQCPILGTPGTN